MGRVSKVRRLPPELREQLHMMLDAGHSLEAIVQHLKSLGADVSRSGLGRYKQQVDKVAQRLRPETWPRRSWNAWGRRRPRGKAEKL